ncbi:CAMK family protein kinase [Tritrichomonas foetus]|uniref:CAMK family protein kinase n=1 Tax=Tritrichomonas foetus TaxID=1144522 RepID=A0A1J4KKX1_9EUKA|nr:CAMK family protein kinase [Tritrichomonas foetus]|eukprot:OHT11875.1 CAMK family protein kinase [Tritrichomonas foetus]
MISKICQCQNTFELEVILKVNYSIVHVKNVNIGDRLSQITHPNMDPNKCAEPDIRVGMHIGHYVVGNLLQSTRNSFVFYADNTDSGKKLVLKLIRKQNVSVDLYEQETYNMTLFSHPNLMSGFDPFDTERFRGYFMEYADMGDLLDFLLDNPRFEENYARQIANQMIQSIYFLHAQGFVHRDIKPENFFLKADGVVPLVMLADFGYTKQLSEGELFPGNSPLGSAPYMAPEILSWQPYGAPVDMWAFGVSLFCLLTKRTPFPDPRDRSFVNCVVTGNYIRELLDDCSDLAKDLIDRCLTVDPSARITAYEALSHPWFMQSLEANAKEQISFCDAVFNDADEFDEGMAF